MHGSSFIFVCSITAMSAHCLHLTAACILISVQVCLFSRSWMRTRRVMMHLKPCRKNMVSTRAAWRMSWPTWSRCAFEKVLLWSCDCGHVSLLQTFEDHEEINQSIVNVSTTYDPDLTDLERELDAILEDTGSTGAHLKNDYFTQFMLWILKSYPSRLPFSSWCYPRHILIFFFNYIKCNMKT